jgi:Family of unknown function (DUF6401)
VSLRLADEVGHDVLDWVFSGDLAAAAQLDQHVAAVRAELTAACQSGSASPHGPAVAALSAGQAAGGTGASAGPRPVAPAPAELSCPDVPFTESAEDAWRTESAAPLRLLLHYACGFVEAAVRADWWPGESAADEFDWESVRLAAVCHLIRQAELGAAAHPELR